jgi:hypothetical protein
VRSLRFGANAFGYRVFAVVASLTIVFQEFILGDYAGPCADRISRPFPFFPILL